MGMKPLLLLFVLIFLSGCTQSSLVSYKNDIITQESLSVFPSNPYAGGVTTIQFLVQNNGDKKVDRVVVDFFDLAAGAFKVDDLKCEDGQKISDAACQFSIEPQDYKKFILKLRAPSTGINTKTDFTISYSISYDYSGYRQADIPVIDASMQKPNVLKYRESQPSYGPVQAEFEPPIGMTRQVEGKTVKEYWATKGQAFFARINFKDVAKVSSTSGKAVNMVIPKDQVSIVLKGVNIAEDMQCDFDSSGKPKKDVRVPDSMYCSFMPNDFEQMEAKVSLGVSFSYTYTYFKSLLVSVLPLEKT
jgi:hypothetical protein